MRSTNPSRSRLRGARRARRGAAFGATGRVAVAVGASAVLAAAFASPGAASNPYTLSGNNTQACAVAWRAQSDVSGAYPDYSNAGYLYEVAPGPRYPALQGPGHFLVQHWFAGQTINYRLPVATDHTMYDVNVRIGAGSANWALNTGGGVAAPYMPTATNLDLYRRFDGDARFTVQAPAPRVTVRNGEFVLHWDVLPAGSAGIYSFTGTAAVANPGAPDAQGAYAHFIVDANLTAKYAEGAGCDVTQPPAATPQPTEACYSLLGGRTLFPLPARDITARIKTGADGETNADGWGSGDGRYVRLYGATDRDLTDVTFTAKAAQGLTFASPGTVITGTAQGMGALYGNGYTALASGVGTPTLSADGTTLTLSVARMPAHSAFAFTAKATPDGSLKQMVIDETMRGAQTGCTPPASEAQGTPVASVPAGVPVTSTPATVTTPPPGPGSSASGLAQATRLAITKTGPRRVRAGARVTYVIRVRNAGQVPARRVVIADTVPASMALAAVPRGVVLRGGRVVLNAGTLAPGARRVVRLTFVLDGGARGVRTNVATAVAANARRVSARSRAAVVAVRHTAVRPTRPAVTG